MSTIILFTRLCTQPKSAGFAHQRRQKIGGARNWQGRGKSNLQCLQLSISLHLSPSFSTPKFARVDPLNPCTRIQLVPTWNYGFVTTRGQHLCMLWRRPNSKPGGGTTATKLFRVQSCTCTTVAVNIKSIDVIQETKPKPSPWRYPIPLQPLARASTTPWPSCLPL